MAHICELRMGTLVQRPGHELELHGCFSKSDLARTRGEAYYMKDKSEEELFNKEYICPNHIKELISDWKTLSYKHVNHGTSEFGR